MIEHQTGKCDICHNEMKGFGCHGFIEGINQIVRYCDECWERSEK